MELGLTISLADGASVQYRVRLEKQGTGTAVALESLRNAADGFKILESTQGRMMAWDSRSGANGYFQTILAANSLGIGLAEVQERDPRIRAVARLLAGIEVHLPFDSIASWAARTYQRPESLRVAGTLFPADRLTLRGTNLANTWSELRSRDASHWDHTMALVRLGLGDRVDSVVITPDAGGGNVYVALRFTDVTDPVLAADLSDGQLSWLAFVAMVRLNPTRSLLAVDEPELHLHPHLLAGVITLLSRLDVPVLLATHADRVLEMLDDPAEAVRVCALDDRGRATVSRVDPVELPKWLEHYGDFGRLRAAGYLSRVLLAAPEPRAEEGE